MAETSKTPDSGVRRVHLPRWAWILVGLSLGLNLMVAGAVVGSFWAHRHGYWHGPPFMHHGRMFFKKLPYERRKELKKLIREAREPIKPLRKEVRSLRKKVGDAVRTEPFDEAAVRQALEALSSAELAVRKKREESLLQIAGKLSAEERELFSKFLVRRHRHRRRGPPF